MLPSRCVDEFSASVISPACLPLRVMTSVESLIDLTTPRVEWVVDSLFAAGWLGVDWLAVDAAFAGALAVAVVVWPKATYGAAASAPAMRAVRIGFRIVLTPLC